MCSRPGKQPVVVTGQHQWAVIQFSVYLGLKAKASEVPNPDYKRKDGELQGLLF